MTNVGIIGVGFMGMIHYLAYQRLGGAKVVALCETDPVRLAGDWTSIKGNFGPRGEKMDLTGIAQYPEVSEMLADPNVEMVDICLPPALHAETAVAALKAGKHVFCEKPIALNPADAERMVDTARQNGRMLMIGHVLPFFAEYNFAYKAITGGQYGKLLGGHFKRVISDPTWLPSFYDPRTTGGPMLDLHVHDAHFIRLVCGMPKSVHSVGNMRGEVVERFTTQFRFDDPAMVVTAASGVIYQQGRPFTHAYEIYLQKATLFFEYAAIAGLDDIVTPVTVLTEDGKAHRPQLGSGDPIDAFAGELGEAVRAIAAGSPSPILAGELARDAVILCQRQTESVQTGRQVAV
jgi:predicted dehydrogenase